MPYPTPYPDVNTALSLLHEKVQSVLGPRLVGLYIHGSLAAGDFTPQRSDIDFVAATDGELPAEILPQLESMHTQIFTSGLEWARKIEGSYVPREALRVYDPNHCHFPALRYDGTFAIDGHGPDWIIQCHVLREQGFALSGPPVQTLIDPVTADDLRRANTGNLRDWWAPVLEDQARLQTAEYRAYAVLTMCRILYTLIHGTVVSKTKAAEWCADGPGKPWAAMIRRGLSWREGMDMDSAADVLELIRFTLKI